MADPTLERTEATAAADRAATLPARLPALRRPPVPEGAARFPVDESVDVVALTRALADTLEGFIEAGRDDPFANPILQLARHVSRRLDSGEITYSALEQVLQYMTGEAFLARARRLSAYLGETDPDANAGSLRALVRALARNRNGNPLPFEAFRRRVERDAFGVVVTAHPTFNLSGELMTVLAELAAGRDAEGRPLDAAVTEARLAAALAAEHRPEAMSLEREHELSLEAVSNLHAALRRVHDIVYAVAEELYPERWTELSPRLLTVASWVGYDLDGRSDIGWTDTLHKRLKDQTMRLRLTREAVEALRAEAGGDGALAGTLAELEERLSVALNEIADEMAVFAQDPGDAEVARLRIQRISKRIVEGLPRRLVDAAPLLDLLDRAVAQATDSGLRRRLLVLRAELAVSGLGMAHVHVRINASQLHNAVRRETGLDGRPDDPRFRVSYLARLNEMLDSVDPVSINFGSLLAERASARRLFMVIAQMRKYVDSSTPVRFLIAECETTFTALAALYLARLFGVDDHVDISPLFETQRALEVGSRMIDHLLDNPHFRAYVARRGRLCVQTGYSDAGRYLGQIPAAASIERFRFRLAKVLEKHGLEGVQLVIFDTHGESVGRGGHPAGLAERLAYVDTPATRAAFLESGLDVKEEVSFQGGDGYLYFMTPTTALAAATRSLEHALREPGADGADLFYAEADYIREVFTSVTEFQARLMDDADYAALLGAFAPNLLYPSGSRAAVRQRDEAIEPRVIERAGELRAIPHNAMLQQLGVLANAIGGLGAAIDRDPHRFVGLYEKSPRLRALMGMAEYALAVSDFDVLKAYVASLDPGLWLARAGRTPDPGRSARMRAVATALESTDVHDRQDRVVRRLYRDFVALREGLAPLCGEGEAAPGCAGLVEVRPRLGLSLVHALRIALMHEIFLLATCVPDFAPQRGTDRERIVLRLLHMEVPGAVAVLERIFPVEPTESTAEADFGEPATYRGDESHAYEAEHARVFRPLKDLYELSRRVSSAVTHFVGFLG